MTASRHPSIVNALNLALAETGCTKDQALSMVIHVRVEVASHFNRLPIVLFAPAQSDDFR